MKTHILVRSTPVLIAAVLGGLVSQIAPLSMQLHAQTTTNAPTATPPAVSKSHEFGALDISQFTNAADVAAALDSSEKAGWHLKMGVGNFAIFTKKTSGN